MAAALAISHPLWRSFDALSTFLTGSHATDLQFIIGKTPLSTFGVVCAAIATYYCVIFGGREIMRSREAFKLKGLFKAHNVMLTAISGSLLILMLEQILPQIWRHGISYNYCGLGGWTAPLVTLYVLNYFTKYLEFVDTVFLVLRKKPLTFLHTYHHGATAFLCYTQLLGHTPVSWIPITLNLGVHVLMYWYYFRAACGVKAWYKEYITMLQILQFVIDIGFIYFTTYNLFASRYAPGVPVNATCVRNITEWREALTPAEVVRSEMAAITGIVTITSYLFLFIIFYFATYKTPASRKSKTRRSTVSLKSKEVSSALNVMPSVLTTTN